MSSSSSPNSQLASIELHLVRIGQILEYQNIAIAQLRDELAAATRSNEWSHTQFGEMLRILARDMRELRATLICSVVSDGPISAQAIQTLLRQTPDDRREIDAVRGSVRSHGN